MHLQKVSLKTCAQCQSLVRQIRSDRFTATHAWIERDTNNRRDYLLLLFQAMFSMHKHLLFVCRYPVAAHGIWTVRRTRRIVPAVICFSVCCVYVTPTASHVSRFQSGWLSFVDLTKTSHQLVRDKRVRFQLRGHSCAFVEYRNRIRWLFICSFGLRATRIHRISQIIPHVEGAGWSRKWLRKTPKQNHLRRVTIFPQR